jgi:hypothetical protein
MKSALLSCALISVSCQIAIAQVTTKAKSKITAEVVGSSIIVLGGLNVPVGKEVGIHGFVRKLPKWDHFEVDMIDGNKLKARVALSINRTDEWREGTEATIRGHEYGILRFSDKRETGLSKDAPFTPQQKLYLSFEPVQVVKGPKLDPEQ